MMDDDSENEPLSNDNISKGSQISFDKALLNTIIMKDADEKK
jgi:hypothetical protein